MKRVQQQRKLDSSYSALPARRIVSFNVELTRTDDSKRIALDSEVWEVKEGIRVEKVIPPKSDEDEDEDEEDEIEVKHRTLSKEVLLGAIETNAKLGIQIKGKCKDKGKGGGSFIVGIDGNLEVELKEVGAGLLDGATAQSRVPAP